MTANERHEVSFEGFGGEGGILVHRKQKQRSSPGNPPFGPEASEEVTVGEKNERCERQNCVDLLKVRASGPILSGGEWPASRDGYQLCSDRATFLKRELRLICCRFFLKKCEKMKCLSVSEGGGLS